MPRRPNRASADASTAPHAVRRTRGGSCPGRAVLKQPQPTGNRTKSCGLQHISGGVTSAPTCAHASCHEFKGRCRARCRAQSSGHSMRPAAAPAGGHPSAYGSVSAATRDTCKAEVQLLVKRCAGVCGDGSQHNSSPPKHTPLAQPARRQCLQKRLAFKWWTMACQGDPTVLQLTPAHHHMRRARHVEGAALAGPCWSRGNSSQPASAPRAVDFGMPVAVVQSKSQATDEGWWKRDQRKYLTARTLCDFQCCITTGLLAWCCSLPSRMQLC